MQQINIRELLASKDEKIAKKVPGFLIRSLGRLIRLDKINYILANYSQLPPIKFIDAAFKYIGVNSTIFGVENIPKDKKIIFAANHPLGGLDGMALVMALNEYSPKGVKVVVNDLLMNLDPLAPVFVPVNKLGKQNADNLNLYNEAFESDVNVITFPSGMCSRLIDGKIVDLDWKTSFVHKAIACDRIIVPIFVDGTNSKSFYRFAKLRKWLKIKANLEMLYLPKEMFDQENKNINMYVGKPIAVDCSKSAREWTKIIRDETYKMKP